MESMIHYQMHIQELHSCIKIQVSAMTMLGDCFVHEAQYQYRDDQARSLDDLKKRVQREIKDIERMETASSIGFAKGTLLVGLAQFTIGSLWAVVSHSDEHPLSVGLGLVENSLERTAPFGTIVIAVGPKGFPDDVQVIPLSKWARDQDKEESEVVASLRSSYPVMSAERFFGALEEVKGKVLKGVISLPVSDYLDK